MATATGVDTLRKGDKVVAAVEFPRIPAGTTGKVTFVEGFEWIRYWVRFANGETKGSINRAKLARPDEWAEIQARRERGDEVEAGDGAAAVGEAGAEVEAEATSEASEGAGADGAGRVPAYLLERSRARREFLGK